MFISIAKKAIIVILVCIGCVVILYEFAPKKINHDHRSFNRVWHRTPIKEIQRIVLSPGNYYWAGADENCFFLGNTRSPFTLTLLDSLLSKSILIEIDSRLDTLQFRSIRTVVNSPSFYMSDGTVPFLCTGNTTDWKVDLLLKNVYFQQAVPISNETIALVAISDNRNTVEKASTKTQSVLMFPDLLVKQVDGIFCTKGKLLFDRSLSRIIYLYSYRNEFMCLDTNMTLLYRATTIDTISKAKIKVGKIASSNTYSMLAAPLLVNGKSYASQNRLYVNSNILAKNEEEGSFDHSSIIDVYSITNGVYLFSFYIPSFRGRKMKDFLIRDQNTVAVVYDATVILYQIVQ